MKKKLLIFKLLFFIVMIIPTSSIAAERPQFNQKFVSNELLKEVLIQPLTVTEKIQFIRNPTSKKALEQLLIERLTGEILAVVGRDWNRGHEKILEIKKEDRSIYIIIVQVISFDGPHNPPYVEETITFKTKGYRTKPIDYFNRVIPEKEWRKVHLW